MALPTNNINNMKFNQLATVLQSIVQQATGKTALAVTDTSSFISVAQTAVKSGYDPVLNAITQVLSKTLFSVRPYSRKFAGLMVDTQKYGNHVRKLVALDKDFENDDRLNLVDGQSLDMYTVNKPKTLQLNWYGENQYQKSLTIFKDQLDTAFNSPDEFQRFLSMIMTNASDQIEQAHENTARAIVQNFIAGKYLTATADGSQYADHVIHLLSEYNSATGLSLTSTTVYQPENFKPFMQWVYSRIATLTNMMTERSLLFHQSITNADIMRHTPLRNQKVYLYAPAKFQTESMVLSNTHHDNYMKLADNETVNFWQSIKSPTSIKTTPVILKADGTLDKGASTTIDNVFGVIFDEEALGYTVINQWSGVTPFNQRGGYANQYWHFTDRYWNDFTENGVVLLLD